MWILLDSTVFVTLTLSLLVTYTDCRSAVRDITSDAEIAEQNGCQPRHTHISFGKTIVDMKIQWATIKKCENCEVFYGTSPWNLNDKAPSKYVFFNEKNKKGVQHLYMADLRDLLPNSTYYYTPVCARLRSGPYYFHIPALGGDWAADYIVFGDMGIHTHSIKSVIEEAQSGCYTAIIHAGDFAYNLEADGGQVGDKFMEMIEPAAAFSPYLTCPGNHEIDDDTFSNYRHRFSMPDSDWPIPLDKMWYSIDIGLVHFVSYSSEVFFTNKNKHVNIQKEWLLKDLALANSRRNITPWVVAFGHRPLYCSTRIGDDCSLKFSFVRNGLEKIFYEMKVDILLQAHEHNYERLWPMYQEKITDYGYVNVSAPIQIITGAAGSHFGTDHFVKGDQPKWSAFRMGEPALNSYGKLRVYNKTHIWWEQRTSTNHTVIDGIWIVKDDLYDRAADIPYNTVQSLNKNVPLVIVAIFCIIVVVSVFLIPLIVRFIRRKNSFKKEHAPLMQYDEFDEDSEEQEEFSQEKL